MRPGPATSPRDVPPFALSELAIVVTPVRAGARGAADLAVTATLVSSARSAPPERAIARRSSGVGLALDPKFERTATPPAAVGRISRYWFAAATPGGTGSVPACAVSRHAEHASAMAKDQAKM